MKILLVIDNFGSGGAQRQLVKLAQGLKKRGHTVEFFIYQPQHVFFRSAVVDDGIKVNEYIQRKPGFSFGVLFALYKLLKGGCYDIALSYLDAPNVYLMLASFCLTNTKIIVSERRSYLLDSNRFRSWLTRSLYRFVDYVVTNSISQKEWLSKNKLSAEKVVCIYNGVEHSFFRNRSKSQTEIKLIAVGRISPVKNITNLILGLKEFHKNYGWVPSLSWVGRIDNHKYYELVNRYLDECLAVKEKWTWCGECNNVEDLYLEYDALILPSLSEGLSNAICEALYAGCPVLASNVCDNPHLVKNGERGYLFDPTNPLSISGAINLLASSGAGDWEILSKNSREFAEQYLSFEKCIDEYECLFTRVCSR